MVDNTLPKAIGRFLVVEEIGAGGMGRVLLAYDPTLDRNVAIKVIKRAERRPEDETRFEREAKAAARIRHPNVITVHDFVSHDGGAYIVMEWVDGRDLRRTLAERVDVGRKLKIAIGLLQGLNAAHQEGVFHRDIKPANVLLGSGDQVKVVDFGLARFAGSWETSGVVLGTLDYLSPERVEGKEQGAQSDIFSAASVLCELFGGCPPFRGKDQQDTLIKILRSDPDLSKIGVPDLVPVLAKALAKSPAERFPSVAEFIDALQGVSRLVGSAASPGAKHLSRPAELVRAESPYLLGRQGANAIRLYGAADEVFSYDRFHVQFDQSPYSLPAAFRGDYDERLRKIREDAGRRGVPFHDGPCARLIEARLTIRDWSELGHLSVTLGPIGWFDFSVVDHRIHEATANGSYGALVSQYVDLERAQAGDFAGAALPNIIETVATVLTQDRQLIYGRRQAVSTVADLFSASFSENIHRLKDTSPDGLIDPFRTVLRGVSEEMSPRLREPLSESDLALTGLCYNCEELHPTFLFLVSVPFSLKEVGRMCRESPGRDFKEGSLFALPADRGDARWQDALDGPWYASGKAGVIRTLEFLGTPTDPS